ncbi:hypothetical protein AAVH_13285 [Aphelenchoides avenae]|nr:hypothetical protein AAVH_13285 [Aphelenchus avenae]
MLANLAKNVATTASGRSLSASAVLRQDKGVYEKAKEKISDVLHTVKDKAKQAAENVPGKEEIKETFQARTNFQKEKPVTAYPGTVVQPKGMSTAGKKSPEYQQTRSNPSDTSNHPTP